MSGILYGLGIGPGDPDLITLKALKVLQAVPVIAYPAPEGGDSLVRRLAAPHIPAGRSEIALPVAMVPGDLPNDPAYDIHAERLAQELSAGRDVAVLCEGDVFLYGSFMYLFERLSGRFETRVVPGIPSPIAAAAAAGLPLVSRKEALCILPAPLDGPALQDRLSRGDAVVIMKIGRHLTKVRQAIAAAGRLDGAVYVERATMPEQRICPLALAGDAAPYFSLVLVPARAEPSPE